MNYRHLPLIIWQWNFPVNEFIIKPSWSSILSSSSIEQFGAATPVEGSQTHGTRLTTAIKDAAFKLEIAKFRTSLTNGIDLGMGCRIIGQSYRITNSCNDFLILVDNDSTKWTTTSCYVLLCFLNSFSQEIEVLNLCLIICIVSWFIDINGDYFYRNFKVWWFLRLMWYLYSFI